jgi:lipid A disaccharide synthetase
VRENDWAGTVKFVTDQDNEHFDAMCSADAGIIYDGQMVSSAAACHLPTMNCINMRMHHMWYNELFNRWWNDMNIIADKNIYPELQGGEAWWGKIADTLATWYVNPETRYNMINQWDGFVQEAMSYKPIDRTQVRTRDIILEDGHAYNVYMDPWKVATRKMLEDINAHEIRGASMVDHAQIKTRLQHL